MADGSDDRRRRSCSSAPRSSTRSTATSARCARTGAGGWCSSAARPGSARRRSCGRSARSTRSIRVLWGACDALYTPRPLGPFVDIADEVGGELGAVVADGRDARRVLVGALAGELRPAALRASWCWRTCTGPTRPRSTSCACSPAASSRSRRWCWRPIATTSSTAPIRCGSCSASCPRHGAVGSRWRRCRPGAVAALAGSAGVDHGELHRRTAGNPFFVTEVLATADDDIPETVRDAVLARVARLDDGARALLDAVAIVPLRAELWLLEALADGDLDVLDACLASGMLRAERDAVGFRHEIARVAVEEALSPHRRLALHRRALVALAAHGARPDPARLAHHAEAADDADAVLRHAPAAGERGGRARLASRGGGAVRPRAALRGRPARASAAPSCSSAARTSAISPTTSSGAIDARRRALRRAPRGRRPAGRGRRAPLALAPGLVLRRQRDAPRTRRGWRWSCSSRSPPGRELAMAYSNMAQLRMLAQRSAGRDDAGASARSSSPSASARPRSSCTRSTTSGPRRCTQGMAGGRAKLERSLALALDAGLEEHVARAYTNLGAGTRASRATTRSAIATSTPGSPTAPSTTSTRGWPT